MRVAVFVAAAGILAGSSGVALAQSAPDKIGETSSYWTATGFVGSSFSTHSLISDATDNGSSLAWGGEAAYLWHGIIGPEALVDFGPNVGITSASLSRDPHLNSYMANAIGSLPLGTRGNVQPYVSGGYGAVQLKADIIGPIATPADAEAVPISALTTVTERVSKLGGNIGFGIKVFSGKIGLRADMRHYNVPSITNFSSDTTTGQMAETLLSGLHFWRANAGVAVLW